MDTVLECDRQTDGRTDRITITDTVQRIALHGKNAALQVKRMLKIFMNSKLLQRIEYYMHSHSDTTQSLLSGTNC